ncbi:MAG TPA: accessory factor UbiK family protein [Leucothrix mucor]|uniref:Ubiquinone biosynthesis accessory factor UbiK n=1 Tax=Leucothrix mucor TaxID=45248 RepID=A0A7V2T428_LEUMU|nr:accessory factor UbiK family protein [Leucothrix mucor]
MDINNQLDGLAQRLTSLLPPSISELQQDVEQNLRSGLESGLRKMNLVSREEFDVQTAVLLRTREKVERLEKLIDQLSSKLEPQESIQKNKSE